MQRRAFIALSAGTFAAPISEVAEWAKVIRDNNITID